MHGSQRTRDIEIEIEWGRLHTCETCGLLECDADFRRVPSAVVTIEEERRFAERCRHNRRRPFETIVRRIGRHDRQCVPAIWTQEAIPRASNPRRQLSRTPPRHTRCTPVLLRAYARAGHLEEAVRAVVATDFDHHAAVAPDGVAFFAEEEIVQWMETVG